jgi:beta-hydroxyacyl-ACP dehydratase FabZ
MAVLENIEIRDILPHRFPFLLVDRIVEIEAERIVGIKNVTANEPFFTGHFPEFPVMPGVLIVEAMAQVAGVLVLLGVPDRKSKLVLFASIEEVKFRKPVLPGDTLRIEMKILKKKATAVKAQGTVTVDGAIVAQATVMCVVSDKPAKKSEPVPAV